MDYLDLAEHAVAVVGAVVTGASAFCAMTKTPDPKTRLGKVYHWIEVAAVLVGKAKDTGILPSDPAADKLEAGAVQVAAELMGKTAPVLLALVAGAALLGLAACQNAPPSNTAATDPAIVAKINYVCAYSGLFKFANSAATSVVPVPGAALAGDAVNAAVTEACLHPEVVAKADADVVALIDEFKALGKM